MQIVRDLAGYTLGRSDLVRRAMSKKKQAVMEKSGRTSSTAIRRRMSPAVSPTALMNRPQDRSTIP